MLDRAWQYLLFGFWLVQCIPFQTVLSQDLLGTHFALSEVTNQSRASSGGSGGGRSSAIVLLLLARGEFQVFNIIILLSLYGAAILCVPLVLSSLFQLSALFLQLPDKAAFAALLLSIYNRTLSTYNLVEISLFVGFCVTCLVSGISIGRRMTALEVELSHLGVSETERDRSIVFALLLVSLVCASLSFALAFVCSSVAIYSISLVLHGPYLTPTIDLQFGVYLALLPSVAFVALIFGWSRTRPNVAHSLSLHVQEKRLQEDEEVAKRDAETQGRRSSSNGRRKKSRRIDAFRIFPRKVILAYFFALVLILVASSFVVMVGVAQFSGVDYSVATNNYSNSYLSIALTSSSSSPFSSNSTMITEQNSRTVYTSSVPETIADGINDLLLNNSTSMSSLQYSAYPMTISLSNVNGDVPLLVRGLPPQIIQLELASARISGLNNSTTFGSDSEWALLGSLAAKQLNAHVGSVLSIVDPLSGTNEAINVTVSGIYSLGNEADYEVLVPLALGQEIGDLPSGVINAIMAPSGVVRDLNLDALITSRYSLKLDYSGAPGTIDVIDSSGYVHDAFYVPPPSSSSSSQNSTLAVQNRTFSLSLPFGSYVLVLVQGESVRTTLGQFVTTKNGTTIEASSTTSSFSSQTGGSTYFLYVRNDNLNASSASSTTTTTENNNQQTPKLLNLQNQTILPSSYNQSTGYWIFQVKEGAYTLILPNGTATRLLVIGNTTYDPSITSADLDSTLSISVSNTNAFSVTVKDAQSSAVIFSSSFSFSSSSSSPSSLSIPVESNRTYIISVLSSASDILLQKEVTMSRKTESLDFAFPSVPYSFGSVPVSDYAYLGIGTPSKSGSFDFLIGGAVSSTIALFVIVFVLLGLTLSALSSQLIISLQKEIRVLNFVFPSRGMIRSRVKIPVFSLIGVGGAACAVLISFGIFRYFELYNWLTFLGYGVEQYPFLLTLPVVVVLSLISYFKISRSIGRGIFGS